MRITIDIDTDNANDIRRAIHTLRTFLTPSTAFDIKSPLGEAVVELLRKQRAIAAIKLVRDQLGMRLPEAKASVDEVRRWLERGEGGDYANA